MTTITQQQTQILDNQFIKNDIYGIINLKSTFL